MATKKPHESKVKVDQHIMNLNKSTALINKHFQFFINQQSIMMIKFDSCTSVPRDDISFLVHQNERHPVYQPINNWACVFGPCLLSYFPIYRMI